MSCFLSVNWTSRILCHRLRLLLSPAFDPIPLLFGTEFFPIVACHQSTIHGLFLSCFFKNPNFRDVIKQQTEQSFSIPQYFTDNCNTCNRISFTSLMFRGFPIIKITSLISTTEMQLTIVLICLTLVSASAFVLQAPKRLASGTRIIY